MAETTINALVDRAVAKAYADHPELFGGYDPAVMSQVFNTAMAELFPSQVALSTVSPDFESVMLQLATELSKDPVWYDFIQAGTGQTLLRFIAAGIAYDQFSIERALQEGFGHLASSDQSIYASAEQLGVRVTRVVPPRVTVRLTRTDVATILELSKFTLFAINDIPFFNRKRIVFPLDVAVLDVELIQGTLYTAELTASGQPYFEIELGDGTKDISDVDVYVTVGGEEWQRSVDNPWNFLEDEKVFWDSTSPNGNLVIKFGNNIFGAAPTINAPILVRWVRTIGEKAHSAISNLEVTYQGPSINTQLSGITISGVEKGRDMQDASFYALMAPHMRAAGKNAVRRSDYRRWAVEYPGVKDALFRGQAELGPNKRSMMNVIGVTLLTEIPLTDFAYDRFVEYIQSRGIYQCEFLRMDPVAHDMQIIADVYCNQRASLSSVQAKLTQQIQDLFSYRLGWLGYEIQLSDITDALEGVGEMGGLIEYVLIQSPSKEQIPVLANKASYVRLTNLQLNMHYSTRGNFAGRIDFDIPV